MTTGALQNDPCKDIDLLMLKSGSHGSEFRGEVCLVELSNRLTVCKVDLREKYGAAKSFSDKHPSISPVVRAFAIGFNDGLGGDDAKRTAMLKPYAEKILGTKTNGKDETVRAWMATDWLVRVHAPAFLDLAGLADHAAKLRGLPPLTNAKIARQVQQAIDEASTASDAARAAARDAAGAAAWAAARDAAGAAARAAAGDAARAAARDAAGDAARATAGDAAWAAAWAAAGDAARATAGDAAWAAAWAAARAAAGDAAGDAARATAGAAAWAAARAAAWAAARDAAGAAARAAAGDAARAAAGATAGDAAWDALRPTVETLQVSACELLDRLILVGRT
jgi:hypothetical protein